MYCEYLLKGAKVGDKSCKEQFFIANSGLMIKFSVDFAVRECERDDFYQLCYLAFEQALKVYEEGKYSFLAYYRRCVLHYWYCWKLTMRCPFKISGKDYKNLTFAENFNFPSLDECEVYCTFDDKLLQIENDLTIVTVWEEVKKSVPKKDYEFLIKRFRYRVKYKDLAEELGVSVTSLNARQRRLLFKLKDNKKLEQIARDCFEI